MKFLLNVYTDQADPVVWESGELVDAQMVADASTSAVVRVRDGVTTVADGPYRESAVQVVAYYLVDCEDRERACELAATMPAARYDAVEVRPVMVAAGWEM
ncbi:YciI family protein [Actinocrispum wychmicini]|uniref:YCII-related domain-containing protein n=1 Tax=Actinocrispum wychmicini TaxID=1213861 RepID=A0A4R2JMJ6_9PSEU|nr:YciI family protein [Actinocrispum wychmicini]TCO60504.1 YCII-related domain-containing protein [Actinocrispum wychmicini]